MRSIAILAAVALASGALAKLPPQSEEEKAKAAEAAAKTAWTNSVANYKLCQSMDKVAAQYRAQVQKQGKAASAPTPTPPCTDPGPFAYTPAASKPLEASGAHSPPPTATTAPSTTVPHAQTAPKK